MLLHLRESLEQTDAESDGGHSQKDWGRDEKRDLQDFFGQVEEIDFVHMRGYCPLRATTLRMSPISYFFEFPEVVSAVEHNT